MLMLTLNQIKNKLVNFFERHKQVKQVVYADDFKFSADRNLQYPVVNIEYLQSGIKDKALSYSFKIVIGDRIQPAVPDSEDEIFSDSILIAEDFFSFFNNDYDIVLNVLTNIQKFSDDKGDRVSGIVFRINLEVIRSYNECAIPLSDTIATPSQFIAYYGWVDAIDAIQTLANIQALQFSASFTDQADAVVDYTTNSQPKYLVYAEPISQPIKAKWYVSTNNNGTIGKYADDLFKAPVTVSSYRYYITAFETQQEDGAIFFKVI